MRIKNNEKLIDEQLKKVSYPIRIDDIISGDRTEVVVEFKGRSSRFKIDNKLSDNINLFIDNLPVITVEEVNILLNKYNISLSDMTRILEDEELLMTEDITEWVSIYNNQDAFLPIDIIERVVKGNICHEH